MINPEGTQSIVEIIQSCKINYSASNFEYNVMRLFVVLLLFSNYLNKKCFENITKPIFKFSFWITCNGLRWLWVVLKPGKKITSNVYFYTTNVLQNIKFYLFTNFANMLVISITIIVCIIIHFVLFEQSKVKMLVVIILSCVAYIHQWHQRHIQYFA